MTLSRVVLFSTAFLMLFSCEPGAVGTDNSGTTTTTTAVHGGNPAATEVDVSISGFAFVQRIIDIAAGGTVTWTNNDASTHTITSTTPPGEVSSGNKTQTQTHSHVFSAAGTYSYRCNIHTSMTGTVIVH